MPIYSPIYSSPNMITTISISFETAAFSFQFHATATRLRLLVTEENGAEKKSQPVPSWRSTQEHQLYCNTPLALEGKKKTKCRKSLQWFSDAATGPVS